MGFPGSSATFLAAGTVCQSPAWLASWIVAPADGLLASSVMPRSDRERTWPRSTTRLPVQAEVHQSVPASPSIAFGAGSPVSVELAVACPDSAQLTVGTAPAWPASLGAATARDDGIVTAATRGTTRTTGTAVIASRRANG